MSFANGRNLPDPNANFEMGEHERLSERFKSVGDAPYKSVCYLLVAMKRRRVGADYKITEDWLPQEADIQIGDAERLMQKLADLNR